MPFRLGSSNYLVVFRRELQQNRRRDFLLRFKDDPIAMADLRRIFDEAYPGNPAARCTDDQILAGIGNLIESGQLLIAHQELNRGGSAAQGETGDGDSEAAAGSRSSRNSPPGSRAGSRVKKKTWVEFAVVDMEGNPVTNQKYMVMLPDGSLHEGTLDRTGVVRFDNIDPENSVFSLPDLDKEAWQRKS